MFGIVVAALAAALITAFVTPGVRRWSEKNGLVDQPDARRVNKQPMPRAGGVAIYLGFVVAVLIAITVRHIHTRQIHVDQPTWTWQLVGVLVAATFMAIVGLVDDFKNLAAKWQALALVAAGVILAAFGVRIEEVTNPFGHTAIFLQYDPHALWPAFGLCVSVLLTVLWVFVVTKTVDAIDGVDGLAAGVCAISATAMALMAVEQHNPAFASLALVAAALAGACLGFLRHNYHPAKIIMGTIGAWVLGIGLASISILGAFKGAAAVSVLVPVLALGVPIFDYTHVLGRRLLEHAPLTQADKRHLHHRLLARGWNQRQVVWCIYSIAFALCLVALFLFRANHPHP
ncbi:MAG TPA: MraY family glycosyltransferase [Chthonomonadaceae bacterium]|nr:MraY family glycosyltransferase [Chthonomonadaceae bacterium]